MATRKRKTRKYRGSRTCGWGQVGQHRASGHKGGVGAAGQLKHHFSSMLRDDPGHFGHDSTHTPGPPAVRRWASIRDLGDLFAKFGVEEGGKKILDLGANGYDKLLGGGKTDGAYTIKVKRVTAPAESKVKEAGGEVLVNNG